MKLTRTEKTRQAFARLLFISEALPAGILVGLAGDEDISCGALMLIISVMLYIMAFDMTMACDIGCIKSKEYVYDNWRHAQIVLFYIAMGFSIATAIVLNIEWVSIFKGAASVLCILYDAIVIGFILLIIDGKLVKIVNGNNYLLENWPWWDDTEYHPGDHERLMEQQKQDEERWRREREECEKFNREVGSIFWSDKAKRPDPWSHPWRDQSYAEQCRERRWRQTDIEDFVKGGGGDPHDHFDWEDIEDAEGNGII